MPNMENIHIDVMLGNISIAYKNEGFVAEQIFPIVPVKKDSDKYGVYGKENFRIDESLVADKTPTKEIGWNITQESYQTQDYGYHALISNKEKLNADKPINLRIDTTEMITEKIKLGREKRVLDIIFDNTKITQTSALTTTNKWSDYDDSDPGANFITAKNAIKLATGKNPNVAVLTEDVYNTLVEHPYFIEKIKYSMKGIVTADLMAQVWGLKKVLVSGTLYESATEGQTSSLARTNTKKALFCYVNPKPGLKTLTLGYTLQSKKPVVTGWHDRSRRSDVIEVIETTDEKLVAAACGYLFTTVIA